MATLAPSFASRYSDAYDFLYDNRIIFYVDGSAINNGYANARAGYGVWFQNPDLRYLNQQCRLSGDIQSNNRAELTAIITALETAPEDGRKLIICSDSQYAMNTVMTWINKWRWNGWVNANGFPVANRDLIEELDYNLSARGQGVQLKYVPAHEGVLGNEKADRMARYGATLPPDDV
ncbi:related to Ribonuclease H [Ustilago sp. UG-2017b]|nr:related to Ribonuclease H [Ustilago sp. UG-2017b]